MPYMSHFLKKKKILELLNQNGRNNVEPTEGHGACEG